VELPEERVAQGKPRRATIRVRAALRGDMLELTVSDDGRGLDLGAIREQVDRRGLNAPTDDAELAAMIFQHGLSTMSSVTQVAGRGVGLDVVKAQIEAMHGTIELSHQPGAGTRFVFTLPLTLTTLRVLFVVAGGECLALPTASVHTLVRASGTSVGAIAGRDMLLLGAAPIPIVSLAATLGLPTSAKPEPLGEKVPMVVIGTDGQRVALAVDGLLAEQDVVLKALPNRIRRAPHIAGATILANGQLSLVLRPAELARAAMARTPSQEWSTRFAARAPTRPKRLLLVDDSITTRTLEKSILEAAGHEVTTASDVSDVEMPNMNGFTLTETIRKSKRFKSLPVILLTGLHTDQDRVRGMEIGADAYLLKTTFDQKLLLETIRNLL
jgi:two-component system chemotaxis sensor kinase CheA